MKKMVTLKHVITTKEFYLALAFSFIGFLLTTRLFLNLLEGLNVFLGFLVYYVIIFLTIFVLSKLDLVIFGFKIENMAQKMGLLLITFSFFILVNWTNPYVNIVTHDTAENVSNIYFMSEDGITWAFWDLMFNNSQVIRVLTFIVTPFFLTLLGGLLVTEKFEVKI